MAEDTPAAAPPAANSPLSSSPPSPSPSPPPAAPAAASTNPTAPPATTTPTTRPEGIPDERWDATANALKLTPQEYAEERKKFNEYATRIAADDVRKGTLPQTADAYKAELPADFVPPAGVAFRLDPANPSIAQIKAVAHKHGWTQEALNDALGVYAGNEVGTEARIASARQAEVTKLGPSGPARVDAVTRFLDASGMGVLKSTLVTAAQVEAWENHITKLTSQGGATFTQSHRAAPDTAKIPGFEKMSYAQQRQAQDRLAAEQRTQRRA